MTSEEKEIVRLKDCKLAIYVQALQAIRDSTRGDGSTVAAAVNEIAREALEKKP